jgi:hypothetical protein
VSRFDPFSLTIVRSSILPPGGIRTNDKYSVLQ